MIDLYTFATPNGYKVSVALEELQLPYEVHSINLMNQEQRKPEFLKINPNGRIPAIIDRDEDHFPIFESGAILLYLAEKTGQLMPQDRKGKSLVTQWLMFQMGGVGPMMGQANVFFRYFPEKIQPAIDRYQSETKRLLSVLDQRLEDHEFLAGDYSIADIANWCWARTHSWSGVSIDNLPHLQRWIDQLEQRPACQKGVSVPFDVNLNKISTSEKEGEPSAAERFAEQARSMVQGIKQ